MNALRRMLDVLALITPQQPAVTVEQICHQLGYAPASAYRYVRELTDFGLLVRLPSGYALGPRIIEMDLQLRENDPILGVSRPLMEELARETGLSVLLSELYEERVITIHQEFGLDDGALSFGRGRPMPLFRSATSRIILAHLAPRQLKRVFEEHADNPDVLRLGGGWKGFAKTMLEWRRSGWCISRGELEADRTGLAAPIFDEKRRILGSITLVGSNARFAAFNEDYLSQRITAAAQQITWGIGANAAGAPVRKAAHLARPHAPASRDAGTSTSRQWRKGAKRAAGVRTAD
jgi:DNA-binding IclR family transcriptional regulator